jgi:hypothetical protein
MVDFLIFMTGISLILSIFMIVVVAKAIRVGGMRIFRYLLASFTLILISDFILILTAFSVFGTTYIDLFIFSLTDLFILLIFYSGVVRGS